MAESRITKHPFQCNIEPITRTNSMSLFTNDKDIEFRNFLRYTIIELGGQIEKPKTRLKKQVKSTEIGLKEQAVIMVLQMINQSPKDKLKMQAMLGQMLGDEEVNSSLEIEEEEERFCFNQFSTIIEVENDDYDSRIEKNGEEYKNDNEKLLLKKRGFELFDSAVST